MSTARRDWKAPRVAGRRAGLVLALALGFATAAAGATTERIVVDWRTGLAIHGFDPVAYFTDAKPMLGLSELEYPLAGAVWRFRNPGNRGAFASHPDIYMPRFGGYDPLAVARRVATPGHPQIWAVNAQRLYLFHSVESRAAFAADPDKAITAAQARWPEVVRGLVP